uniref:Cyclin C n=1 Tax=Kwoniella dejecticola CBS 10117 TaxID=1296121 RepID=A0A1A6AEF2_9TREE|nr:cyclin C [Kwoniella dejecticola CBS 10117]OBR88403.1 cyclin C [Kwoniella dejecticola CBS 10117]
MSSSFWSSSHCLHWLTTRPALLVSRQVDLQYCTPKQLYCLNIFFAQLIQKLGKRLLLRQIPIATACVFFKRFYLKNSICETNPYLVLAACLFVAAKVEETPVHIKSVVSEAKVVFNEYNIKLFPAETNKLGEMEFYLLEDLDFHLVIFHPYRALLHMTGREPADSGKFPLSRVEEDQAIKKKELEIRKKKDEEIRKSSLNTVGDIIEDEDNELEAKRVRRLMGRGSTDGIGEVDEGVLQISWFILNDTYRTDVHLLYPPYIISLSAIYIAFCLTSMNSSSASRTRTTSSSSQLNSIQSSTTINEQLGIDPPPNSAANFLAGFQVNLNILFACVQDIICLYSIWENFEPTSMRNPHNPNQNQNQSQQPQNQLKSVFGGGGGSMTGNEDGKDGNKKEKFGPEEAEALVRRMIESRLVDMGHPNNAGANQTAKRSLPVNSVDHSIAGKKRARK